MLGSVGTTIIRFDTCLISRFRNHNVCIMGYGSLLIVGGWVYKCSLCMCHYQVGIMQYLEHNLAKCATIV